MPIRENRTEAQDTPQHHRSCTQPSLKHVRQDDADIYLFSMLSPFLRRREAVGLYSQSRNKTRSTCRGNSSRVRTPGCSAPSHNHPILIHSTNREIHPALLLIVQVVQTHPRSILITNHTNGTSAQCHHSSEKRYNKAQRSPANPTMTLPSWIFRTLRAFGLITVGPMDT